MAENNTLLEKLDGLVARFEEVSGRKSWHLSDRNPNRKRQQVDWKAIIQNKTGRREAGSCSEAE